VFAIGSLRSCRAPDVIARRVEARVSDREITAVALETGELACRHVRSFVASHAQLLI